MDLLCNETTVGVARKVRIATVVTHELSHMWPLGLWSSSRAAVVDVVGTSAVGTCTRPKVFSCLYIYICLLTDIQSYPGDLRFFRYAKNMHYMNYIQLT